MNKTAVNGKQTRLDLVNFADAISYYFLSNNTWLWY